MATKILESSLQFYREKIVIGADPVIDSWILMKTPFTIIGILLFYLHFIYKLGPQLMANRPAFNLKPVLIVYNAFQILFCSILFYQGLANANFFKYFFSFGCRTVHEENPEMLHEMYEAGWWYLFSKVIDLLDTVFFVLRKKQRQVTFLHVYHHTSMVCFVWIFLKYSPCEQGVVAGFVNTFVHVIMYFYYLVAALGPQYQRFIWWKKYMTQIQLGQFGIIIFYLAVSVVLSCGKLSAGVTYIFIAKGIIFTILFADFYRKEYLKKEARLRRAQELNHNYAKKIN